MPAIRDGQVEVVAPLFVCRFIRYGCRKGILGKAAPAQDIKGGSFNGRFYLVVEIKPEYSQSRVFTRKGHPKPNHSSRSVCIKHDILFPAILVFRSDKHGPVPIGKPGFISRLCCCPVIAAELLYGKFRVGIPCQAFTVCHFVQQALHGDGLPGAGTEKQQADDEWEKTFFHMIYSFTDSSFFVSEYLIIFILRMRESYIVA